MDKKKQHTTNNRHGHYEEFGVTNIRHQIFIDEYLKNGNATHAYAAAYPKCGATSARSSAAKILTIPNIKSCIDTIRANLHGENMAEAAEIRQRLTQILRGQAEAEKVVIESTGGGFSAARTINVKPNHSDIINAADKLLKLLGAYETERPNATAVEINIVAANATQLRTLDTLKKRKADANHDKRANK